MNTKNSIKFNEINQFYTGQRVSNYANTYQIWAKTVCDKPDAINISLASNPKHQQK